MEPEFWIQRWEENRIGFHEGAPNAFLVGHLAELSLDPGARLLLPLCGKTQDIPWLLNSGFSVVGVELAETAVQQLFDDLGLAPTISQAGSLRRYSASDLDVFAGDIFEISGELLGPVDAIYDRAALVALPAEMRQRYAEHLADVSETCPQLIITFAYDQGRMNGPPFSVTEPEVERLYGDLYKRRLLASGEVDGGLKGHCPASESAWLLEPKAPT